MSLWGTQGPFPPPTELVRFMGHLVMGGITGFGAGMVRMRMPRRVPTLIGCVLVSMLLHFAWDWIAISADRADRMEWWQTASAMVIVLSGMLFYGALIIAGSDWSRNMFAPGSRRSMWGWPVTLWFGRPG
jgi:hypothetical protein